MIVDLERRWVGRALCTGMPSHVFFIDHSVKALESPTLKIQDKWDAAKKVCGNCPVKALCARDSLGEIEGVWGGLDPAERQRLRTVHSQEVRRMTGPRKDEYAALAYHLHKEQALAYPDVARKVGVSIGTAKHLVHLHTEARLARAKAEKDTVVPEADIIPMTKADWPGKAPADGDGWVRYCGRVVRGYYLGQTSDGEWYQMKVPLSKEYSTAWFKAEDVKILRRVQRVTRRRAGEMSRIYGTTISGTRERAKAG